MSYLVLARKWRPHNFTELAGQAHVVRALTNALTTGRVHHAFLFTGTRGVGKTTLARILAKSLNCETGVTATPCGSCKACTEIDAGRFMDLIEVDAASRTKVDDTRELLDNVQYAPTNARYKVYLIDEVHMLSTHSFNALLKTLEEPPPHVKFLLATTDPQKLPITVLSRCLQFNLKRMPPAIITQRITEILTAEQIAADPEAVHLIARAADGSMRDALSLLDQAIAFSGGQLKVDDTRAMLGTIDRKQVGLILSAIAAHQPAEALRLVAHLDELVPDYQSVLNEAAALLQRTALLQAVPDLQLDETEDRELLQHLAQAFTAEELQLCYQIALLGRRDLDLAPEPRGGFEMILLRMLAFSPADSARTATTPVQSQTPVNHSTVKTAAPTHSVAASPTVVPNQDWQTWLHTMNLQGPVSQLAAHCVLQQRMPGKIRLTLDAEGEPYYRPALTEKLRLALCALLTEEVQLEIIPTTATSIATPARQQQALATERLQAAQHAIENDPNIKTMVEMFGATVHSDSIRPRTPE